MFLKIFLFETLFTYNFYGTTEFPKTEISYSTKYHCYTHKYLFHNQHTLTTSSVSCLSNIKAPTLNKIVKKISSKTTYIVCYDFSKQTRSCLVIFLIFILTRMFNVANIGFIRLSSLLLR